MKTQCPHCQAYFNIKPEFVGKRTKCKNCGQGFIIAEATEVAAPAPSSAPAIITRFAPASSLARALAEKKAADLENPIAVQEADEASSAKISAEEPVEIPEIEFKPEAEPAEKPATSAEASSEAASEIETSAETEASAEAPAAAAEPAEIPEIQFTAETAPQPDPAGAAETTARPEPPPSLDGAGLKSTTLAAPPVLSKPPAVQAQIHEALKSSRPSPPPNPLLAAAVPAFQPVSASPTVGGFGQPGPEWGLGASLGSASGPGLSDAPSSYPASPTFQPVGYPGNGGAYGAPPAYPPSAYPVPSSPSPARTNLPPKNGRTDGVYPPADSIAPSSSISGQPAAAHWPPNGGGAVSGQSLPNPSVSEPRAAERARVEAADQIDDGLIKRQLKRVPRALWIAAALAFVIGGIGGAKMNNWAGQAEIRKLEASVVQAQQQLQIQKNDKLESLNKERRRLADDLSRVSAYSLDYPEGSIPRALALAASEEFKIADTLLLQQIAAVESGAKVTVAVKQTRPDPELAATLEAEMIKLEEEIGRQWQEAKDLAETPKMLASTSIATQMVSLAILNRNLLIARYGLSSPVPLQYRSTGPQNTAEAAPAAVQPSDGPEANEGEVRALAEVERLKKENERLLTENEMLLNSDSTIYASAVSDLGNGRLISAEEKYRRLLAMFPASPLAPKATEGLAEIKVKAAEKEAAKNPPVEIAATGVKHDGGYFRNQTYVRVSFKNISQLMIKRLEFKVLTFDEHGYPIASKRLDITQDNFFSAAMTENIAPGRSDYGVWELSEKVRQVKVKLKTVEFYDAPPWRDEDIEYWVEKEGGRYQAKEVGQPMKAKTKKGRAG